VGSVATSTESSGKAVRLEESKPALISANVSLISTLETAEDISQPIFTKV